MITSIGIGITTSAYGQTILGGAPPPPTNFIITELAFTPSLDTIETETGIPIEVQ